MRIPKFDILIGICVILAGALWLGYYKYDILLSEYQNAQITIDGLEKNYQDLKAESDYVKEKLLTEENKNTLFEAQINGIAGTLGALDKLAKTDKELLQKYSKVYFLNEHYTPKSLSEIPSAYVHDKTKIHKIHSDVWVNLQNMMKDAEHNNTPLSVVSAYRSFSEQDTLKGNYKFIYGSGANQFSADQGYSEHQLGTTVDFTTLKLGAGFESFGQTLAYSWLLENAYRYGFILSYPKGNSYYQFEPWHWRFVGKKLAERLHEDGQNFYSLDQRNIDAYLVNIFD